MLSVVMRYRYDILCDFCHFDSFRVSEGEPRGELMRLWLFAILQFCICTLSRFSVNQIFYFLSSL